MFTFITAKVFATSSNFKKKEFTATLVKEIQDKVKTEILNNGIGWSTASFSPKTQSKVSKLCEKIMN